MASGYRNAAGVDMDNVFDPYVQGTKPSATGYRTSDGVDLNQRYAPLVFGSAAAVQGFRLKSGADFNTLWAAKGTANYALPIDGQIFVANRNTRGPSSLTFNMLNTGSYSVVRDVGGGLVTLASGTWLPAGGTVANYNAIFSYVINSSSVIGTGSNSVTNGAATQQPLSTSRSIANISTSILVTDRSAQTITVTAKLYTAGGTLLSTTTFQFQVVADGN